jgi:hypothetical protein
VGRLAKRVSLSIGRVCRRAAAPPIGHGVVPATPLFTFGLVPSTPPSRTLTPPFQLTDHQLSGSRIQIDNSPHETQTITLSSFHASLATPIFTCRCHQNSSSYGHAGDAVDHGPAEDLYEMAEQQAEGPGGGNPRSGDGLERWSQFHFLSLCSVTADRLRR